MIRGWCLSDIDAEGTATWDFDGNANYNNSYTPIIESTIDMNSADISYLYFGFYPNPYAVIFIFSPPMAPGASFRFSAETDNFVSDPCPGGDFATGDAELRAVYSDLTQDDVTFDFVSTNQSIATFRKAFSLTATGTPGGLMNFNLSSPPPQQDWSTCKPWMRSLKWSVYKQSHIKRRLTER